MVYKYKIQMSYINNETEYIFDYKNIHSLYCVYDYITNNRPILFSDIVVDYNILDDMIKNINTGKIVLKINYINTDSNYNTYNKYIKQEFSYKFAEDINKTKSLDYYDNDKEDNFKKILIGLISDKLLSLNNVLINTIFNNCTILDVLVCYLGKKSNLLIEPTNEITLNNFIVPPINKLTELVYFLNEQYPIYNTKYRLFFDFESTYLVSSSGIGTESIYDEYNTVLIHIKNTTHMSSKVLGVISDKNTYIINVDVSNIEIHKSDSYNSNITSIDEDGNINNKNINDNGFMSNLIRVDNNNTNDIIKSELSSNIIINIYKENLNNNIFTINKEYYIKSDDENYTHLSGKYILCSKKEIYNREDNLFNTNTILSLRKI